MGPEIRIGQIGRPSRKVALARPRPVLIGSVMAPAIIDHTIAEAEVRFLVPYARDAVGSGTRSGG